MTPGDADRVTRLVRDAERAANSITDEYPKAEALRGLAAAVAATDPDRAERIANSITSEHRKAAALTAITQALISA